MVASRLWKLVFRFSSSQVHLQYSWVRTFLSFQNALSFLLAQCKQYVLAHRSSNLTQWHPILGWFSQSGYDSTLHEAVPLIKKQLSLLWTKPFICLLLENSLRCYTNEATTSNDSEANSVSRLTGRNSGFGYSFWYFPSIVYRFVLIRRILMQKKSLGPTDRCDQRKHSMDSKTNTHD